MDRFPCSLPLDGQVLQTKLGILNSIAERVAPVRLVSLFAPAHRGRHVLLNPFQFPGRRDLFLFTGAEAQVILVAAFERLQEPLFDLPDLVGQSFYQVAVVRHQDDRALEIGQHRFQDLL